MLTVGSLFSGIGGMDLGLERAGMRVVWQAEIDAYASRVLKKHWPDVPNFGDVTKVNWRTVERPDVLAGGFMCTDLSSVGKMGGMGDFTRSGTTWRELVRAIVSLRPRYVLVENISVLLAGDGGRWFATVLGALAACGYDAEWDCIPASSLGAPHGRDRVFIVAYPHGVGRHENVFPTGGVSKGFQSQSQRVSDWQRGIPTRAPTSGRLRLLPDPSVCGMDDGVSSKLVRLGWRGALSGYGNAVVPAVAELVGGWIVAHANRESASACPAGELVHL